MKRTLQFIRGAFIMFSFLMMNSCFVSDSNANRIIGNYEVIWIDVQEQQFICKRDIEYPTDCLLVVPEYVFAVGHNNDFIIAKQHPTKGFKGGFEIDTTITNYYIVDIQKREVIKKNEVIGPLSKNEFDKKRAELHISEIRFNQVYPHTPD